MPSLITAVALGTTALLAVPVLALTAVGGTGTCPTAPVTVQATASPTATPPQSPDSPAELDSPGCALGPSRDPLAAGTPIRLPPGYTPPAGAHPQAAVAIVWALAQLGTPYSYGGDCTAPHSTDPRVGSASSRAIPEDLEQFVSNPGCLPAAGTPPPVVAVAVGWALAHRRVRCVRAWARTVGLVVSDRGWLRPQIWDAWRTAHR